MHKLQATLFCFDESCKWFVCKWFILKMFHACCWCRNVQGGGGDTQEPDAPHAPDAPDAAPTAIVFADSWDGTSTRCGRRGGWGRGTFGGRSSRCRMIPFRRLLPFESVTVWMGAGLERLAFAMRQRFKRQLESRVCGGKTSCKVPLFVVHSDFHAIIGFHQNHYGTNIVSRRKLFDLIWFDLIRRSFKLFTSSHACFAECCQRKAENTLKHPESTCVLLVFFGRGFNLNCFSSRHVCFVACCQINAENALLNTRRKTRRTWVSTSRSRLCFIIIMSLVCNLASSTERVA